MFTDQQQRVSEVKAQLADISIAKINKKCLHVVGLGTTHKQTGLVLIPCMELLKVESMVRRSLALGVTCRVSKGVYTSCKLQIDVATVRVPSAQSYHQFLFGRDAVSRPRIVCGYCR